MLASLALLLTAPALAQDEPPPPDEAAEEAGDTEEESEEEGELTVEQMESAEPVPLYLDDADVQDPGTVTAEDLEFFRPERGRLPQHPYAWTPWSAYALEWGEARVGLSQIAVGLAPRVQVGTSVPLDLLGVYNGQLKANLLRVGPVDLALTGAYYTLPRQDFSGDWIQAGGLMSLRVAEPVTLHLGGRWGRIRASGLPDLGGTANTLTGGNADELEAWLATADAYGVELALARTAVQASAALDWRFNRRDSVVLQASATPWASGGRSIESTGSGPAAEAAEAEAEALLDELPPVLYLDQVLRSDGTLGERIAGSTVLSLSYQASFKNLTLRLGGGWSAVSWAWVLPATELSFHFGGKTRAEERRMKRGWKDNRDAVQGGADAG